MAASLAGHDPVTCQCFCQLPSCLHLSLKGHSFTGQLPRKLPCAQPRGQDWSVTHSPREPWAMSGSSEHMGPPHTNWMRPATIQIQPAEVGCAGPSVEKARWPQAHIAVHKTVLADGDGRRDLQALFLAGLLSDRQAWPPWFPVINVVSDESDPPQHLLAKAHFQRKVESHSSWLRVRTAFNFSVFSHFLSAQRHRNISEPGQSWPGPSMF